MKFDKKLLASMLGIGVLWSTALYGGYTWAEYKKEHTKTMDVIAKDKQLELALNVDEDLSEYEYLESIRHDLDFIQRVKNILGVRVSMLTRFGGEHDKKLVKETIELIDKLGASTLKILNKPIHDEHYDLTGLLTFSTDELTDMKTMITSYHFVKEPKELEDTYNQYSSKIDTINDYYNMNMEVLYNGEPNDGGDHEEEVEHF